MGHIVLDIEHIDLYFKKNGIHNINVSEHLLKNNTQIQNLMYNTTKIQHTDTLINNIYNIIRQNNIYNNYISKKSTIIEKIISDDKNLNKQKSKNIITYKKKISDAINGKQLENMVEFEIK